MAIARHLSTVEFLASLLELKASRLQQMNVSTILTQTGREQNACGPSANYTDI
jgi:hypothetical protein